MSYLHIKNLYKTPDILLFKVVFALEKIHGTSAHIQWRDGKITFFAGGEKHERFVALFDESKLRAGFETMGHPAVVVYGEAYGGSQQGQSWRYGKELKFIAFEVKVGDLWLTVPSAHQIVTESLGLEFVHYKQIVADLESIDAERDSPSEQAKRNGVEGDQPREGIVLRPLIELTKNNGDRIIAKHKRDEERETKTPRQVVDPSRLEVLTKASAIAEEWVTPTRLQHVLDKVGPADALGIERTGDVIKAMVEDVTREAKGEIVDGKESRVAISKRTAELFKTYLKSKLTEGDLTKIRLPSEK